MGLPKIKSATEVRQDLFTTLQEVLKGQIQIISHKDGDSVLLSKRNYDELLDKIESLQGIARGLKDLSEGRFFSHKEAVQQLRSRMNRK